MRDYVRIINYYYYCYYYYYTNKQQNQHNRNLPDSGMVQPAGALADFNSAVNVMTSDFGSRLVDDPLHRLLISTIMCF